MKRAAQIFRMAACFFARKHVAVAAYYNPSRPLVDVVI